MHPYKYSAQRENQVILLMISDGETWHYVTVKTLHGLINGAMSKYNSDCYFLNCPHSFITKNHLDSHGKTWKHDYFIIPMLGENTNCISYGTVPTTIWPIFSEFLVFCRFISRA